nr:zinc finger protein 622 [Quercus suber]
MLLNQTAPLPPPASTVYPTMAMSTFICSACAVDFLTDTQRRDHMREPWHVYNLKRRIVGMSPISQDAHAMVAIELEKTKSIHEAEDSPEDIDYGIKDEQFDQTRLDDNTDDDADQSDKPKEDDTAVASRQCLFCSERQLSSGDNMQHMAQAHGFRVPNQDGLQTDLETFLAYLNRVVRVFHSCLSCSTYKSSTEAVQAHMYDRGHRMLDLSPNSDFLEFWTDHAEHTDEVVATPIPLSEPSMRLSYSTLVVSRESNHRRISSAESGDRTKTDDVEVSLGDAHDEHGRLSPARSPQSGSDSKSVALSRRDQDGLIGLSPVQCAALYRARKKAVSRDLRKRNAARWVRERIGNKLSQERFRVSLFCDAHRKLQDQNADECSSF